MNYGQQNEKNKLKCSSRFPFLIIVLILCFLIALAKLIEYQILYPNKYIKQAENSNITKQQVPVARGDIIDRNGKILATNILNLNLIIGEAFPFKNPQDSLEEGKQKNKEGNEILAKLIDILEKNNINWDEDFPITKEKPFKFIETKKAEENKLKASLGQQPYATPNNVLDLLKEKFNIEGYNETQTRNIAALRGNMLCDGFFFNRNFTVLKNIDPDLMNQITKIKSELKGVEIFETATRTYPCGDVAAHIIGHIGPIFEEEVKKYKEKGYSPNELVGKEGIEYYFEDELRGIAGILTTEKDKKKGTFNQYYEENERPKPGNTVRLTIDYEFQKALQEELTKFTAIHKSKGASASKGSALVVLDVKTGDVLASISLPTYDVNTKLENYGELLNGKNNPLKNRALLETYRTGSTFKPFIAASALLEGVINESTRYPCRKNGLFPRMGCLQDSHHGYHSIDIYTAIQRSCNNYFYAVARDLGIDKINEYAPKFGFITDNGLEIRNEIGTMTNREYYEKRGQRYSKGHLYQTGIGQAGVGATVHQMAVCASTIANRGTRYETHLIKEIDTDDKTRVLKQTIPKVLSELPNNHKAWDIVLKGMKLMAQTRGPLKGLNIATKSGSPQYRESSKITNAAAIGFYPADSPEIAFALMVEDGGEAPDFGKVIAEKYDQIIGKKN